MVKTINPQEAASNFLELLEEITQENNQFIVKSNGQSVAVIIPFNDYQNLTESREQAKARFFEMVDKIHQRTKDVPLAEIEDAVNEAVVAAKKEELKELESHS